MKTLVTNLAILIPCLAALLACAALLDGCKPPTPAVPTPAVPTPAVPAVFVALPMPDANAVYASAARSASPRWKGTGEQFCWNTNFDMGLFVRAYEASHDTAWLDQGVKYYDLCVSKMGVGPDGYKGWIGPDGGSGSTWNDRHVGQAVLLDNMLEFAELVLKDPELKKKYEKAAQSYVDLARKDCIEKWDKRGTWREDGPYGAYVDWANSCEANAPTVWTAPKEEGVSLPFNKQNDMALICLKLFRITGEKTYLEKARKIFAFQRSRFQYVADKDYYTWNYWEPFGPWDMDSNLKDTRHWMNVHGFRNYQAGEIGQIVEAYDTGIVFTPLDIQRIVNTNLKVMWNGDKAAPKWINSNALLPSPVLTPEQKKAEEEEIAKNPYAKEGRAGTLWSALSGFSQEIRGLQKPSGEGRDARALISRAYYQNVTLQTPVGFDRKYAKGAKVEQVPMTSCKSLTVAAVMPQAVSGKKPSVVLCKSRIDNDLEVAVYSADGKEKRAVLHKGKIVGGTDGHAGIFILTWDGTDGALNTRTGTKARLVKGRYIVRWTVADGSREFPVEVVE